MTKSLNGVPTALATSGLPFAGCPINFSATVTGEFQAGDQSGAADASRGENNFAVPEANGGDNSLAGAVGAKGVPVTGDSGLQTKTIQANREPTFVEANWPYGLLILIPLIWFCSAMFRKRAPSFKHTEPVQPKRIDPIKEVKGKFKKAKRFRTGSKKTNLEDSPGDSGVPNSSKAQADFEKRPASSDAEQSEVLGNTQADRQPDVQTTELAGDGPAGDDSGFGLSPERKGSVATERISWDDLNRSAEAPKKIVGSSKRFKTQESGDEDGPLPEGEFSVNDDDFAFDDEDSQLSLADSDADFGFDLEDEDEDVLFGEVDSNKLGSEDSSPPAPNTPARDDGFSAQNDSGLELVLESDGQENDDPAESDFAIGQSNSNFLDLEVEDIDDQIAAASPSGPPEAINENKPLSNMVAQLRQKVEAFELEQAASQDAVDKANLKIEELNRQLVDSNSTNEALAKETADLNSAIKSLKDDLAESETKLAEAAVDSNAESLVEQEAIQTENAELKDVNESLLAELNSLKKECESQQGIIATVKEDRMATDQKVALLESELDEIRRSQVELQAERDKVAAELETQAQTHDDAVGELRKQLTAANESRDADKAEIQLLSSEIQSLQEQCEQAKQAAAAASNDDSEIEELRANFKRRVAQEHRKRKAAEAQTLEAEQQRNELAKTLRTLKAKLSKEKS